MTPEALLAFNDPAIRRVGMPGGGGVMRAEDLAGFYQAVLHNPGGMWKPEVLADAVGNVRNHLPDPLTGVPANRTLGLVQAGDDGKSHFRGMGRTVSPRAVGHNGAGGQIAWGDPTTGLSLRLRHQRPGPARGPRAPPHDRAGQPRRGLHDRLTATPAGRPTATASQPADVDRDRELLRRGGADDDAAERRDVAVVAAPGDGDVAGRCDLVVGRVAGRAIPHPGT